MIIYQIHEVHGKHMANTSVEALANEANGWKTVTEAEFYGESKPKVVEQLAENNDISQTENEFAENDGNQDIQNETEETDEAKEETGEEVPRSVLEELYEMKFGEKPHHRMKNETIKAKLEEE